MPDDPPITVVTGATGAQGRAVASAFAQAGHRVRGLTRKDTQGDADVTLVRVDPNEPGGLERAFEDASAVVLTSPIDHRAGARERLAEAVVRAAERAGVTRLVLNTAAAVFDDYDRPVSAVLREVRQIVLSGRVPAVVLQPTAYMDNLLAPWVLPAIVGDGVFAYPLPPQVRASWISHADLGRFALAAATAPGVEGQVFDIGGPEPITGPEMAAVLSRHIGRDVTYAPIPLDEFAAGVNAVYGAPTGDDVADLNRYVEQHPRVLERDPAGWSALGVQPESFANWAARQQWQGRRGAAEA